MRSKKLFGLGAVMALFLGALIANISMAQNYGSADGIRGIPLDSVTRPIADEKQMCNDAIPQVPATVIRAINGVPLNQLRQVHYSSPCCNRPDIDRQVAAKKDVCRCGCAGDCLACGCLARTNPVLIYATKEDNANSLDRDVDVGWVSVVAQY